MSHVTFVTGSGSSWSQALWPCRPSSIPILGYSTSANASAASASGLRIAVAPVGLNVGAARGRGRRSLARWSGRRRGRRGTWADFGDASFEGSVPENIECRNVGAGRSRMHSGGPVRLDQIERGLRLAGPRRQAFDRRARVVHRLNRRLRQADEARRPVRRRPSFRDSGDRGRRNGPGVAVSSSRSAVLTTRGTRRISFASVAPSGRSYTGLAPSDEERPDFAARQLGPQRGELRVVPRALVRRARQIDRRAVGADRLVDEVAERLDAHVLASGDHQPAAASGPEPLGDRFDGRVPGRRGQSFRGKRGARALRQLRGQVRRRRARSRPGRRAAADPRSIPSTTAATRSGRDRTWPARSR